jgi:hypothetical protein
MSQLKILPKLNYIKTIYSEGDLGRDDSDKEIFRSIELIESLDLTVLPPTDIKILEDILDLHLLNCILQFLQKVVATIRLQRWWRSLYYAPTGAGFHQAQRHFASLDPI